ncbi:MAG: transposase [Alphaproteobacteria bacterium]
MMEAFIASFDAAPDELILDFYATDDAVHGRQEGRFFHGYHDHDCFLPRHVNCMCSAASRCWSALTGPRTSTGPSMPGPF